MVSQRAANAKERRYKLKCGSIVWFDGVLRSSDWHSPSFSLFVSLSVLYVGYHDSQALYVSHSFTLLDYYLCTSRCLVSIHFACHRQRSIAFLCPCSCSFVFSRVLLHVIIVQQTLQPTTSVLFLFVLSSS